MNVELSEVIVQLTLLARELQTIAADKSLKEVEAVLMAIRQNATKGLVACREANKWTA